MKLTITVSKTVDGAQDYLQILSGDAFSVNIVLLGEIEVHDTRGVLEAGLPADYADSAK